MVKRDGVVYCRRLFKSSLDSGFACSRQALRQLAETGMTKGSMDQQIQQNLLDLVKSNYEEIADDFDVSRKKTLWPELVKLAGPVRDGDKVLDAGCGNGRLFATFAGKGISYLGVDGSEKLIAAANENFLDSRLRGNDKKEARQDHNNFKFQVGDILALDKISEKDFDYVFCIAVLHHLPGENLKVEALEQMKHKLKPGGKIIITVWNLWHQQKFRKLILKYSFLKIFGKNQMDFGDILFNWKNSQAANVSQRYYHAFTKSELKRIFNRAGLRLEKLYQDQYNYYAILGK